MPFPEAPGRHARRGAALLLSVVSIGTPGLIAVCETLCGGASVGLDANALPSCHEPAVTAAAGSGPSLTAVPRDACVHDDLPVVNGVMARTDASVFTGSTPVASGIAADRLTPFSHPQAPPAANPSPPPRLVSILRR
jgi:hypothetical protein